MDILEFTGNELEVLGRYLNVVIPQNVHTIRMSTSDLEIKVKVNEGMWSPPLLASFPKS